MTDGAFWLVSIIGYLAGDLVGCIPTKIWVWSELQKTFMHFNDPAHNLF